MKSKEHSRCALMKQDNFKNQKSGLEEIYINHNLLYNKNHQLKFLYKFHPELRESGSE